MSVDPPPKYNAPPIQYMEQKYGLNCDTAPVYRDCGYNLTCKGSVTVCMCSICKCKECNWYIPTICYVPIMIIPNKCDNCVGCHPECVCCYR